MNMTKPAIVSLSTSSIDLAKRIALKTGGQVHGFQKRIIDADVLFENVAEHLTALFASKTPIIAIMASGAVIRILAPQLINKMDEAAVISVSEDGSSIVPLLGGHHGANDLARQLAEITNGFAAVTTAGDLKFGIALDQPPEGYHLTNPDDAKDVMAALLNGASVDLVGQASWLTESQLDFADGGEVQITVTEKTLSAKALELVYIKKSLVLGVGCERGCSSEELLKLAIETLDAQGYSSDAVGLITSIDLKADETAIHALAQHFNCPVRFFPSTRLLDETKRLKNPSDVVFGEVGCYGVAEGSALVAAGQHGDLIVEKQKSKRATLAIGQALEAFEKNHIQALEGGQARGKLFVVGIGPGADAWRSPEVSSMVASSTDLVGYSLYLDLLGPLTTGKTRHDFDLGKEEARVRHAMELAGQGKDVALVCSGDAGIYAMATLVFELLDKGDTDDGLSQAAKRIEIAVSPGISALQAAAARIGAPLGHDFCTISLSDLLTPWEDIKRRVSAAAEGDFVIAFYNPVSMKRRTQLAWARDRLLDDRPDNTPVILATNLGREGELVRVVDLAKLDIDDVDMLTVVIVGSSESRTTMTGDGKTWVYTPRGYSGKSNSIMGNSK
jgi:cobalt-precorrin 5A hydrolase/precorrin-3B C17-methyltransferase